MALETTLNAETVEVEASTNTKTIKQGDMVWLPLTLYLNGEAVTESTLVLMEEIEYALGRCTIRRMAAADAWNETMQCFLLPVYQRDTQRLCPGYHEFDVRVQFYGGGVLGVRQKEKIKILDANSKEVI